MNNKISTEKGANDKTKQKEKTEFDFFIIGDPITEVTEILRTVETDTLEAKLNETTIDDGNGGRIELNEDDKNIIKK